MPLNHDVSAESPSDPPVGPAERALRRALVAPEAERAAALQALGAALRRDEDAYLDEATLDDHLAVADQLDELAVVCASDGPGRVATDNLERVGWLFGRLFLDTDTRDCASWSMDRLIRERHIPEQALAIIVCSLFD